MILCILKNLLKITIWCSCSMFKIVAIFGVFKIYLISKKKIFVMAWLISPALNLHPCNSWKHWRLTLTEFDQKKNWHCRNRICNWIGMWYQSLNFSPHPSSSVVKWHITTPYLQLQQIRILKRSLASAWKSRATSN